MKNLAGFTLIETLVAIAVLTLAITLPYATVEKALTASYIARDQLAASTLAAEGLEYVRGVRDSNYIYNYDNPSTPISWMGALDGSNGSGVYSVANCFTNSCTVDTYLDKPVACSVATCTDQPLHLISDGAGGQYYSQASGGTVSRFSRALKLTQITTTEVRADVTVTWTTNGRPYSVKISEYFDNWLQ